MRSELKTDFRNCYILVYNENDNVSDIITISEMNDNISDGLDYIFGEEIGSDLTTKIYSVFKIILQMKQSMLNYVDGFI